MLGVDRKILAKALFLCLQKSLPGIIGEEQTCVVPGRNITDTLALLRDTYLFCEDRETPLAIVGFDLEKAFDKISHLFLKSVLGKLGFGSVYRSYVDLLYMDCTSKININRHLTEAVDIGYWLLCPWPGVSDRTLMGGILSIYIYIYIVLLPLS